MRIFCTGPLDKSSAEATLLVAGGRKESSPLRLLTEAGGSPPLRVKGRLRKGDESLEEKGEEMKEE